MEDFFRVGVFANTHGIRGEIKVYPTTDDANRFKKLKKVILRTKKEDIPLEIEGVKFFKKMVILKLKGIDNINDIERYKGSDLLIPRSDAVPLEEGEFYLADLIGLAVIEKDGRELGVVKEVLQTGANDVYVVSRPNQKELLLPAITSCILDIDVEGGRMTVCLLDGLEEL